MNARPSRSSAAMPGGSSDCSRTRLPAALGDLDLGHHHGGHDVGQPVEDQREAHRVDVAAQHLRERPGERQQRGRGHGAQRQRAVRDQQVELVGLRQVLGVDHAGQGRVARRHEQQRHALDHERDREQRQQVLGERDRHVEQRPRHVGGDDQLAPVVAVRQHPGDRPEERAGQEARHHHAAQREERRPAAGLVERRGQDRQRDEPDPVPQRRDQRRDEPLAVAGDREQPAVGRLGAAPDAARPNRGSRGHQDASPDPRLPNAVHSPAPWQAARPAGRSVAIRRLAIVVTILAVASAGSLAAYRYGRIGAEREAAALAATLAAAEEARVAHEAVRWRSDRGLVDDETDAVAGRRRRAADRRPPPPARRRRRHGRLGPRAGRTASSALVATPEGVAVTLRSGAGWSCGRGGGHAVGARPAGRGRARSPPARSRSPSWWTPPCWSSRAARCCARSTLAHRARCAGSAPLPTPSSDAVLAALVDRRPADGLRRRAAGATRATARPAGVRRAHGRRALAGRRHSPQLPRRGRRAGARPVVGGRAGCAPTTRPTARSRGSSPRRGRPAGSRARGSRSSGGWGPRPGS